MAEKGIEVEVTKLFGDFCVLQNIKFKVKENEFLCVVGPSGCGKTTLLRTISGLIPVSKGGVTIDGEHLDLLNHRVSFVFQEPSCLPWLTVEENVRLGLQFRSSDEDSTGRIRNVLSTVGLTDFAKYYPNQLSGGMKQRVAIARAFAGRTDLLLMDEPFGHLDAQTRYYMQIAVKDIWERMKTTVIFVTNDVEEAVYLGERALVLSPIPARILAEIPINLAHPREQTDPAFLALRKEIADYIEVAI